MHFYHILVGFLVIVLSACGPQKESDILATVNGKTITKAEFDAYLKFKRIPVNTDKQRERYLDQYVEREALASVIEKEGLLDTDMAQVELNEFRKEMYLSRYFEKFLKDKVTNQAVQNYYNTHIEDYKERKVHVAHILIRTNPKMSETERKAKLTTAQEAYAKVHTGEDFAKVAEQYSEDKVSAKKGGDIGWIKEGSINKKFSELAFTLEAGKISEPFETPFGFHVLKVIEAPKEITRPLETAKGDIRYQLRAKAKKAELERLMEKTKISKK